MMLKNKVREVMKLKRIELSHIEKGKMDATIFNKICKDEAFIKAKSLFVFVSLDEEVDTHKIICYALELGKLVFVPKVISRAEGMKAIKINSFEELKPGKMGILEPGIELGQETIISDIDLVILPGLAFDRLGGRVGYGGGFYDRFINNLDSKVVIVGLCYDFQVIDIVPMEAHDVKTDKIITENIIINI